jgi:hypothetical protein
LIRMFPTVNKLMVWFELRCELELRGLPSPANYDQKEEAGPKRRTGIG